MRYSLYVCAVAGFMQMSSSLAAASGPNFGAIAFSPATGAIGSSIKMPTRAAAKRQALIDCRRHASDCRVVSWFFGGTCGALAQGKDGGWGAGWAPTKRIADSKALRRCLRTSAGCVIKRRVCSG